MSGAAPLKVSRHVNLNDAETSVILADMAHRETARFRRREYTRYPTTFHALIFSKGRFQTTKITDLSQGGARLTGPFGAIENDEVTIQLLDRRMLDARVRWWVNGYCGVEFVHPLSANDPLILHAIKRNRDLRSEKAARCVTSELAGPT